MQRESIASAKTSFGVAALAHINPVIFVDDADLKCKIDVHPHQQFI